MTENNKIETETMRVVMLASGQGTLLQSVIDMAPESVQIVAVGTDRQCSALERAEAAGLETCLLYTSPSPRDVEESRMPSSA